jgi:hypothetical protein
MAHNRGSAVDACQHQQRATHGRTQAACYQWSQAGKATGMGKDPSDPLTCFAPGTWLIIKGIQTTLAS